MRVKILASVGQPPIILDAAVVLVENQFGEPISVACEGGAEGIYWLAHTKDPDFQQILRSLGIASTVIVDSMSAPKLPQGARLING